MDNGEIIYIVCVLILLRTAADLHVKFQETISEQYGTPKSEVTVLIKQYCLINGH